MVPSKMVPIFFTNEETAKIFVLLEAVLWVQIFDGDQGTPRVNINELRHYRCESEDINQGVQFSKENGRNFNKSNL